MTTTFDTSGYVEAAPDLDHVGSYVWSDLSPFTQGYIEALLTPDPHSLPGLAWRPGCEACRASKFTCDEHYRAGAAFSDLAPETLARIIADCEAWRERWESRRPAMFTPEHGARFWAGRNKPGWDWPRDFPPLTVQLGDDGKVRFAQ